MREDWLCAILQLDGMLGLGVVAALGVTLVAAILIVATTQ
jgi:hypothetical protein